MGVLVISILLVYVYSVIFLISEFVKTGFVKDKFDATFYLIFSVAWPAIVVIFMIYVILELLYDGYAKPIIHLFQFLIPNEEGS